MNGEFHYVPPERNDEAIAVSVVKTPLSTHRRQFTRIGFALCVLIALFEAGGYLILLAVSLWAPAATESWWLSWVLSDVPLYLFALPVMYGVIRRVPTAPFNPTYRDKSVIKSKPAFGIGLWTLCFVICIGLMNIGSDISTGMMSLLSHLTGKDYQDILQGMMNDAPLWVVFLGTAVIAPLGEEFIFRKLLIDRTRQYGDLSAIWISAVTFSLFHRNVFQFVYAFLVGVVLAYVYTRTNRYWLCVALHAGGNFVGGVVPSLIGLMSDAAFPDGIPETLTTVDLIWQLPLLMFSSLAYTALTFSCSVASVILLICLMKNIKLSRGTQSLTKGQTANVALLNVGLFAFSVICIGLTVISLVRM